MDLDTIVCAEVMDYLKSLPDRCVQTCITSPPYWGLRDYGVEGQLGLEPTPEEYVEKMVAVFQEVRRVLRDDGTLWLNLGDSYAMSTKGAGGQGKQHTNMGSVHEDRKWDIPPGLKPKDLCGIPWRVALALQADGWYLRSDIIWSKPNPMPESVTDRPTKAHEYMFLLTKSAKYYWDQEAVREQGIYTGLPDRKLYDAKWGSDHDQQAFKVMNGRRNIRSVWTIPTQPFPEAHYATYPERLVEPCIKAGTSEYGCCPECEAPWERVVSEASGGTKGQSWHDHSDDDGRGNAKTGSSGGYVRGETIGWRPTCSHNLDPVPCIVLDPFMGSGTTALVAVKLRRHFIGCDLNPENVEMAYRRLSEVQVRML